MSEVPYFQSTSKPDLGLFRNIYERLFGGGYDSSVFGNSFVPLKPEDSIEGYGQRVPYDPPKTRKDKDLLKQAKYAQYMQMAGAVGNLIGAMGSNKLNAAMDAYNGRMLDIQRRRIFDAARAEKEEKGRQLGVKTGRVTASFAQQGVKVDTGIAQQTRELVLELGMQDMDAIDNRAAMQAMNIDAQKANLFTKGAMERSAVKREALGEISSTYNRSRKEVADYELRVNRNKRIYGSKKARFA